jgi:hypothetical protein
MHPNNPAYRSSKKLVMGMAAIMVAISGCAVNQATVNPVLVPAALHFPSVAVAPPPGGVGCYYKKPGHEDWQKMACVPQSVVDKRPRQQVDATVFAASGGNVIPATNRASSLWEGYTNAWFSTFSGETDSFFGPDAFSIQANTNFFPGTNGHTDIVQFTYTYSPPGSASPPQVCVVSIDNITNSALSACANTPVLALTSSFGADVYGLTSGVLTCKKYRHGEFCLITYNLTAVVVTSGGSWAVTAPDYYGLSYNWNQLSGTIVGAALGSQAIFTSPTTIGSNIGIYAPSLNGVLSVNSGAPTAETNNLNFITEYTFCNGYGWCYLVSTIGN